jgi:hypothetical protein
MKGKPTMRCKCCNAMIATIRDTCRQCMLASMVHAPDSLTIDQRIDEAHRIVRGEQKQTEVDAKEITVDEVRNTSELCSTSWM